VCFSVSVFFFFFFFEKKKLEIKKGFVLKEYEDKIS